MSLVIQLDPMAELRTVRDALALEAISPEPLKGSIGRFFSVFQRGLDESKAKLHPHTTAQTVQFTRQQKDMLALAAELSFSAIEKMAADTPEGFVGQYVPYLQALQQASARVRKVQSDVVQPYVAFVAQCVSSRELAFSTDRGHIRAQQLERSREQHHQALGKFFNKSDKSGAKIGAVIERQSDWGPIFTLLQGIQDDITSVNNGEVERLCTQAADYLQVIQEEMAREDSPKKFSPELSARLAQETYSVAQELEFMAVISYRFIAIDAAISRTVARLVGAMA